MLAIFEFMGLMRVRGPAARDAAEAMLSAQVQATFDFMLKKGLLPPPPPEVEGHLDKIQISIAPWKTLEAMAPMVKGFGKVVDRLGFEIIHLRPGTGATFLSSDNPVIHFDPNCDPDRVEPYKPSPTGKLELLFPIGPSTLIRGHTDLKPDFAVSGFRHAEMTDPAAAMRVNRLIARFAYRLIIAHDRSHDGLAAEYAAISPVVIGKAFGFGRGQGAVAATAFGPKNPKVPWKEFD
jgi:hypothetical protein